MHTLIHCTDSFDVKYVRIVTVQLNKRNRNRKTTPNKLSALDHRNSFKFPLKMHMKISKKFTKTINYNSALHTIELISLTIRKLCAFE